MQWARQKSGYSIEDAAKRINREVKEVEAWESGELKPTLAQARKAAEIYKRPLAVFFLPKPPKDFDTLRDFRKLPKDISEAYSPQLAYTIRRLQSRQQWISNFLQGEGYKSLGFLGSASVKNNPDRLAAKVRSVVGIEPENILECKSRQDALQLWIDRVEEAGVYVCQAGNLQHEKISVDEARGIALMDKYAPFIFINARDAKAAQLFTLTHELVHLWINEPGLSNLVSSRKSTTDTEKIEVFCNKVAAEILVPQLLFKSTHQSIKDKPIEEQIVLMSIKFKVSQEVIARRYLDYGKISPRYYRQLIQRFRHEFLERKEKEKQERRTKEGGPNYYLLKLINNGRAFTQTVINAYKSGEVSGITTANLLEMKINYIPTVADMLHLPLAGRRRTI